MMEESKYNLSDKSDVTSVRDPESGKVLSVGGEAVELTAEEYRRLRSLPGVKLTQEKNDN